MRYEVRPPRSLTGEDRTGKVTSILIMYLFTLPTDAVILTFLLASRWNVYHREASHANANLGLWYSMTSAVLVESAAIKCSDRSLRIQCSIEIVLISKCARRQSTASIILAESVRRRILQFLTIIFKKEVHIVNYLKCLMAAIFVRSSYS